METKVGWIPDEWECHMFGDIVDSSEYGLSLKNSPDGNIPIAGMKHISDGKVVLIDCPSVEMDRDSAERYFLRSDDLLFNRTNSLEHVGKLGIVRNDSDTVFASYLVRLRVSPTGCPAFIAAFFNLTDSRNKLKKLATPGVAQYNINATELKRQVHVPFPPLAEQKEIAEILYTCDGVIEATGDLIKAKKRQKIALTQQILTGKKRLPEFDGKWMDVMLGDICKRLRDVAENPDGYPVLSITAGTGFVSQQDKFSRVIAGKQVEHYVLLKRGEFAYNKGNSYRYPQGCVYQLTEYEEGLVPNVFYSFKLNEKKADPGFIKQYFLAGLHNRNLYRWINSGVRNNGLLNLNATDFFKLPINLPPIAEQKSIGNVLRDADAEIKALSDKLSALKQQKKSLMQKLLTGQVRVKV
jgi:type I restriction enzyme S subunit